MSSICTVFSAIHPLYCGTITLHKVYISRYTTHSDVQNGCEQMQYKRMISGFRSDLMGLSRALFHMITLIQSQLAFQHKRIVLVPVRSNRGTAKMDRAYLRMLNYEKYQI